MYIKKIHLRNIRGFAGLDLDLKRPDDSYAGWTVFAGRNGSGKTTLLQALALALYGDALGKHPSSQWIRQGAKSGLSRLEIMGGSGDQDAPSPHQVLECEYGWSKGGNFQEEKALPALEGGIKPGVGWLLVGYGPFRRLSGGAYDQETYTAEDRVATLLNEGAALPESISWLKDINHQRLEGDKKAGLLEDNIIGLLNDGLLPDGVRVDKVSSKGLHILQNGGEFTQNQLSDGYRGVLSLVLDMVRHLNHAFGGLKLKENDDHLEIPHEGVILIDEIDAHLHISWQKRIGNWLKTRFPKIQFLVTTHSPFICQAADRGGLIRLGIQNGSLNAAHLDENTYYAVVNGSIDEAVITDLFGLDYTHSESAEALRGELAQLEGKMIRNTISPSELERRKDIVKQMPQESGVLVSRAIRELCEAGE